MNSTCDNDGTDRPAPSGGRADDLNRRVVRGGAWLASLQAGQLAINLTRTVVLARLLAPSDFGLLGIALLAVLVLRVLTETGFQQALVQRKEVSDAALDAAWTLLLTRNLAIAAVLFAGAGIVARAFGEAAAGPVLRGLCATVVVDGFVSIAVVLFEKRLDFRKRFTYQTSANVADLVATVTLAIVIRSVWALVWGRLAGSLVRMVVSYVIEPRRPKLRVDGREIRSLFSYGKWLTASSVLVFVLLYGDDVFVAKVLGATMLGYYQIAFRFSNLPATAISHVLAGVLFPAYSRVQDDAERLAEMYRQSLRLTAVLAAPVAALAVALADPFTRVFLGQKWLPAVPLMMLLGVFGLMRAFGATTGAVFMAVGRPDIRTRIQTGQLVVFAAAIYPLSRAYGVTGVAMAATLHAVLFNAIAVAGVVRLCRVGWRATLDAALIPVVAAIAAVAASAAAPAWTGGSIESGSVVELALKAALVASVYTVLVGAYDATTGRRYARQARELRDLLWARHDS